MKVVKSAKAKKGSTWVLWQTNEGLWAMGEFDMSWEMYLSSTKLMNERLPDRSRNKHSVRLQEDEIYCLKAVERMKDRANEILKDICNRVADGYFNNGIRDRLKSFADGEKDLVHVLRLAEKLPDREANGVVEGWCEAALDNFAEQTLSYLMERRRLRESIARKYAELGQIDPIAQ